MACLLLTAILGEAMAGMYKYVDEKGSVHVTDNYGNIPEQYRSFAKEVMVDSRSYAYTPSVGEVLGSERYGTGAWFDISSMPIYERWFLLSRAGLIDIKPVLKVMSPWIGLALGLLTAAYFVIFKFFETPAKKGAMVMLVIVVVGGGLFYKYIRVVEGQSRSLARKVHQMRNINAERQRMILGVLESVPEEGR